MFRKEILKIVSDYIRSNHEKIKVTPGKCRYNFHCHSNSVHEAIKGNHDKIALVVYFDGQNPIVHFVNVTKKGKFKDNTLGVWTKTVTYYLIRFINENEFDDVYKIHSSYRNHLKNLLPQHYRWFHETNSF